LNSQQPHPDSEFKIDGSEVTQVYSVHLYNPQPAQKSHKPTFQVTFVGQVHLVDSQHTNITYKIDDGTGLIDVKQWIDSDLDADTIKANMHKQGEYLRVWGRLKSYNNKRLVAAHILRPIADFNEISYHLLEATAIHLYFTRGPPDALNPIKGEGMFVDNYGAGTIEAQANGGSKKLPSKLTQAARNVFGLLQNEPQNNEGLHVHNIASKLNLQVNDVFKAGDELLGEGLIYTTVDDETWAVLEY
jgi:replication factor A2